jgi:hypothetical protein
VDDLDDYNLTLGFTRSVLMPRPAPRPRCLHKLRPYAFHTSIRIRRTPCRKKVRLYSIMPLLVCQVSVRRSTTRAIYLICSLAMETIRLPRRKLVRRRREAV